MVANGASGREVLSLLHEYINEGEQRRESLELRQQQTDSEIKELIDTRGELFAELAKEYLPELSQAGITETITEAQEKVRAFLNEKNREVQDTNRRMNALQEERTARQRKLEELRGRLQQTETRREKLERQAKTELDRQAAYIDLRKQVEQNAAQLMQNEQRLAELQQERSEKLPAYEQDPLFAYLIKRNYGKKEYRANTLTRMLDGWIAKMLSFHQQREKYDFLRSTGELVALEVERRKEELKTLLAQVKQQEEAVFQTVGLTDCLAELEQLHTQREAELTQVAKLDDEVARLRLYLQDLEATGGAPYSKAIGVISTLLAKEHRSTLQRRAAENPGERDDQLVQEIISLESKVEQQQAQLKQFEQERSALGSSLNALESIRSDFLRNDYDSERSQFQPGFDAKEVFEQLARGQIDANRAWDLLRGAQFFPLQASFPTARSQVDRDVTSTIIDVLTDMTVQSGGSFGGGGGTIFGGGRGSGGGSGGGGFSSGHGF